MLWNNGNSIYPITRSSSLSTRAQFYSLSLYHLLSFQITAMPVYNRQPWLHVDGKRPPISRALVRIFICMFVYVVQQFYPASPLFHKTGTGMDSHVVEKLEQDKCSLNCMFCFLMVMDYNNVLILGDGFYYFIFLFFV